MLTERRPETEGLYGMLAEFEDPATLTTAARRTYEAGYRQLDAYSPIPVHGLAQTIGFRKDRVALVVLIGGLTGAALGFGLECWAMIASYPLNIGGRPLFSWPSFIPVTFECMVLFAGFSALLGMLALNGLPRLHHPVFGVPQFARASVDRFFLLIKASDPRFEPVGTRRFLEELQPQSIAEVPNV